MKRSYKLTGATATIALMFGMVAFLLGIGFVLGFYGLIIYAISALISYVFGIDFGFWQTAGAIVITAIISAAISGASDSDE